MTTTTTTTTTSITGEVESSEEGHVFLKLDSGMTEVLRPSLYGAQHPFVSFQPRRDDACSSASSPLQKYIITGHCCESGDLFSCKSGESEVLHARTLPTMHIHDMLSIEGTGAYCSSMSTKNYNSFPEASEVMIRSDGRVSPMRRRQTLQQIIDNEINIDW